MNVLVLNCGSSSLKYRLFTMPEETSLAWGSIERIGEPTSDVNHHSENCAFANQCIHRQQHIPDHEAALKLAAGFLKQHEQQQTTAAITIVGHRVVHGGMTFNQPAIIDTTVIQAIRENIQLAPLHNPANLTGIEQAMRVFPNAVHVAVFDTAFHQTMPEHAFRYALPEPLLNDLKIRRYGFHGTSHRFVAEAAANHLKTPLHKINMLTLHLGNGASIAALKAGKSIDTSMGMTPLEGLLMGTRCGDIDPSIPGYLCEHANLSALQVSAILNQKSGLKGICNSNDLREILQMEQQGNQQAQLAIEMMSYRIKKYIGAYSAILPDANVLVFTGGIGENSPAIRQRICSGLEHMGIIINPEKNLAVNQKVASIHTDNARVQLLVVATNEELAIAREIQHVTNSHLAAK